MSESEYRNLKIALASTAIEGYKITPQTEIDCMRLINKEISVDDMVKEILARHRKQAAG